MIETVEFDGEIADDDEIRVIDSAIADIERSEANIRRVRQDMQRPLVIQVPPVCVAAQDRRRKRFGLF